MKWNRVQWRIDDLLLDLLLVKGWRFDRCPSLNERRVLCKMLINTARKEGNFLKVVRGPRRRKCYETRNIKSRFNISERYFFMFINFFQFLIQYFDSVSKIILTSQIISCFHFAGSAKCKLRIRMR